ncbi:malonyl-ACP O-methyltransferase BioC [Alkalimarinus coralli]|uniref:malonyl-ACP O-methyltransferase BioC n=1 Tax=Alkalimarinus coralli TaxID=2935863 RepID=UPI00202AE28B|nr:malonyl-ACP O-methyltransferase BioC [Alkalimarinus coralli]
MNSDAVMIEKRNVAASFGRAATSYDTAAHFQRSVGDRLLALLPSSKSDLAVDLGCGTGHFTPMLGNQLKAAQTVGIDLSEGMITYARENRGYTEDSISWLVGDAENLPIATGSVDVIFTSLAIQWCDSYHSLFEELYRVLKPGGDVVFSTLLDGTLKELELAWREVDSYRHVNTFVSAGVIADAVKGAGFETVTSQQYTHTLKYPAVKALTRELKMLGAHNVNEGRPTKVTGRERILRFKNAYERFRGSDGMLPATYEVFLGRLRKPLNE